MVLRGVTVAPGGVAVAPGGVAVVPGGVAVVPGEAEADPVDRAVAPTYLAIGPGVDRRDLAADRMHLDAPEAARTFPDAQAVDLVGLAVVPHAVEAVRPTRRAVVPDRRSSRSGEPLRSAIRRTKTARNQPSLGPRSPTRTTKAMIPQRTTTTRQPTPTSHPNRIRRNPHRPATARRRTTGTAPTKDCATRTKVKRETVNSSPISMRCWPRSGRRKRSAGNATTLS